MSLIGDKFKRCAYSMILVIHPYIKYNNGLAELAVGFILWLVTVSHRQRWFAIESTF